MKFSSIFLLTIMLVLFASPVLAETKGSLILINSKEWQDVYSISLYAALSVKEIRFVSPNATLENTLTLISGQPSTLFNSIEKPVFSGFNDILKNAHKNVVETINFNSNEINLQMARRAFDEGLAKNVIITSGEIGHNPISVMAYARQSSSFVLLVDSKNIDQVIQFLNEKKPQEILVYGKLPARSITKLTAFKYEQIDKGDKYSNNVEILKKYASRYSFKEVTVTTGLFFEEGIALGSPVLYVGVDNVPTVVSEYLSSLDEKPVATVIGVGDVFPALDALKRTKLIKGAVLKVGQLSTSNGNDLLKLDIIGLPFVNIILDSESAVYNTNSKKLSISFVNPGGAEVFFIPQLAIFDNTGNQVTSANGIVTSIAAGDSFVYNFDVDLTQYLQNQPLQVEITSAYGEDENSREHVIIKKIPIDVTAYTDNTQIAINSIKYSVPSQKFEIAAENPIDSDVFARIRFETILNEETLSLPAKLVAIKGKNQLTVTFDKEISKEDALKLEGKQAIIFVNFGAKKDLLINNKKVAKPITVDAGIDLMLIAIILLILIIAALIFFILKNRKKNQHGRY